MKHATITALLRLGVSYNDARTLGSISRALHAWAEMECGTDQGGIQRDDATGRPFWAPRGGGPLQPMHDTEKDNLQKLAAAMANYPDLVAYHQRDPRGAALYILRKSDVPNGDASAVYHRGVAVA